MNFKKFFWIIIIFGIILGLIYFFSKNNATPNDEKNYNALRTSQNLLATTNSIENNTINESNDNENTDSKNVSEEKDEQNEAPKDEEKNDEPAKEKEVASFTTKIYTKDSDRQNNLSIACSTLNNTTIANGKTFSFSKTVGKATSSKGYKKANVFRNGDVIEALGGGLCQVSTTLYNAVLKIPELKVTERHPHSNKVPYIKPGKDAAVSFGAQDFKFINNTGNTIKIKASNTKNNVTVKILKLE